ncbi:hypothetical protein SCUP234_11340 [Seiridium cupressi]
MQKVLVLSNSTVEKQWAEMVAKGEDTTLSEYQFVEATQLALADFAAGSLSMEFEIAKTLENLPIANLAYEKCAADINDSKDDVFNLAHAQLTLSLTESMVAPKEDTTDINNADRSKAQKPYSQSRQDVQSKESERLLSSSDVLTTSAAQWSLSFRYSVQRAAKSWQMSKMGKFTIHAARGKVHDALPLPKGDVACVFSGHQAALVIRMLSKDTALCGCATVSLLEFVGNRYTSSHAAFCGYGTGLLMLGSCLSNSRNGIRISQVREGANSRFNDWNAMQLNAFYTGPNGYHWALKHNQEWSARCRNDMIPFLQTQITTIGPDGLVRMGRGRATSLAFGPGGTCWFVRYNTNQCIWGPDISAFPSTWKSLIGDLERSHPRKDECIEFVAFGQYEILLVRFENGNSHMALPDDPAVRSQISSGLIQKVEERLAGGWTLGNRTALCEFDTTRWFIEWKRGTSAIFSYSMGDGEGSKEVLEMVKKVLSGAGNDAGLVASHQNAQLKWTASIQQQDKARAEDENSLSPFAGISRKDHSTSSVLM